MKHILAIDQGTTSSRAIVFDANMAITAVAQQEFHQHYPNSGWVEHNPDDLLQSTLRTCHEVIAKLQGGISDVVAIGITNQRETTLVWDKRTGQPIYNAIVWQDRRTSDFCEELKSQGLEETIIDHTGLLLDPYFSGTKLAWLLANVDGAQTAAEHGDLLFGTVDSYLIWHLTGGAVHATDATNAARTMLYDIRNGRWDADVCAALNVPMQMLPEVRDCAGEFGHTERSVFGESIPILGVAGDQQAATLGQACFRPGMMKSTYGTGCFALLNTGSQMVCSSNRLLTTIAYQINGTPTYALEGSIFIAGAVVQWLRDGLGIIENAAETQDLAKHADPTQGVYMVPAFTGLGAPYWDANCRGAIFGLTRNSGPAEFAKAALESVGYQTRDLLEAMAADMGGSLKSSTLRVDGGMAASDWTMQFLADITDIPVERPKILETTAMGVAWLAGMQSNFYPGQDEFASTWAAEKKYSPSMDAQNRVAKYRGWKDAVSRTLNK